MVFPGSLQRESIHTAQYLQTLVLVALHSESIQVALVSANVGLDGTASGVHSSGVVPGIDSGGTTSKGGDYVVGHG